MSADHATPDDAATPSEHDPYGLVPESFVDDWGASSIPDALAAAEAAPSTTDSDARKRCPDCLDVQLTPLPSGKGAAWECDECHARHETALPALRDARERAGHAPATEREAARPRCRGCLSTRLYPVPERAPLATRWGCLDCGATFDTALPSERVEKRGGVAVGELRRIQALRREDGQAGLEEVTPE